MQHGVGHPNLILTAFNQYRTVCSWSSPVVYTYVRPRVSAYYSNTITTLSDNCTGHLLGHTQVRDRTKNSFFQSSYIVGNG